MLQTMFQTLYQINKSNEAQREAAASAGASTSALLPPPTLAGENDNLPPTYDEAVQGEPKTTTTMTSAAIPPPPPPNVVTYQYVTAEAIPPHEIPDHMVMAVLATLCCCLPLGIVAIIKASGRRLEGAENERIRMGKWIVQLNPALTNFKGLTIFFCKRRTSVIANKRKKSI